MRLVWLALAVAACSASPPAPLPIADYVAPPAPDAQVVTPQDAEAGSDATHDAAALVDGGAQPDAGGVAGVWFDAAGGSLLSQDGKVQLVLPPGAVSQRVRLRLSDLQPGAAPNNPRLLFTLELEPAETAFEVAASLTVAYAGLGLHAQDVEQLQLAELHAGGWRPLSHVSHNLIRQTLTGELHGTGSFALLVSEVVDAGQTPADQLDASAPELTDGALDASPAADCDPRVSCNDGATCEEHGSGVDPSVVHAMCVSGEYQLQACPVDSAVGGCRSNAGSACSTLWYYAPQFADAAQVRQHCADNGRDFVPAR